MRTVFVELSLRSSVLMGVDSFRAAPRGGSTTSFNTTCIITGVVAPSNARPPVVCSFPGTNSCAGDDPLRKVRAGMTYHFGPAKFPDPFGNSPRSETRHDVRNQHPQSHARERDQSGYP